MVEAPLRGTTAASEAARGAAYGPAPRPIQSRMQVRAGVEFRRPDRFLLILVALAAATLCGCGELRGRRLIQRANQLYRDGQYKEAVAMFREAEQFVPDYWMLWLNMGYTCQQMVVPGAKTPENDSAIQCALQSFQRLQTLKPSDPRGSALYVQTLFDTEQYEPLAGMYQKRFEKDPNDEEALNGLVQVFSKWPGHLSDAIAWYHKKAERKASDAEAQYSAGVYVWQQLFAKGGGADKAQFDPRPDPNKPNSDKVAPAFAEGDIVGEQRAELADLGIKDLERAIELRPRYHEATVYLSLIYRQKSFAHFDRPDEWQKCIDKASEWREKTLQLTGQPSKSAQPAGEADEAPAERSGSPAMQPANAEGK
jgi:tetratricopeptide (TPR) repeat protein